MEIFKKTPTIRFMKYKYVALVITAAIVLAGVLNIAFGRGLKLGVDFGEGTLIRVMYKAPVSVATIREELRTVGLGNSSIQESWGKQGRAGREFQIRATEVVQLKRSQITPEEIESHEKLANKIIDVLRGEDGKSELARGLKDLNNIDQKSLATFLEAGFAGKGEELAAKIIASRIENGLFTSVDDLARAGVEPGVATYLKDKVFLGKLAVISRETVGPQAGAELRKKAVMATIWSLIGMLVYIALRFRLANGVSAIFTLAQDVLITVSVYSFTSREINLPIVAALLTIVGFSINDTIVIFDRIRENQKIMRKMPLEDIMNLSLNQMLGRTFITSGTVFLTVLALFLFGGPVINDFAFIMLIGTIEGVYSTVYLSCPVVLFWTKWFPSRRRSRK
jgi:preprotein translocase subunit SecF